MIFLYILGAIILVFYIFVFIESSSSRKFWEKLDKTYDGGVSQAFHDISIGRSNEEERHFDRDCSDDY